MRIRSAFPECANKTLLISKAPGIEGKKLLRPDDDFAALRDFDRAYEGEPTVLETMHLECADAHYLDGTELS